MLPIPKSIKRILILGSDEALNSYTGKGSGKVLGYDIISPLQGIEEIYGRDRVKRLIRPSEDDIKTASVILYFINKPAGEGIDIPYDMPKINDELQKISSINPNIVVLYSGGNGLPMPWLKNIKGLLFTYFLGQEGGRAIAHVLSGNVNPSGKLPFTVEKDFKDNPAFNYNKLPDGSFYWKGGKINSAEIYRKFGRIKIPYKEGIYIGYRWYDKHNIEVQFPFGYGLSYTTFSISSPETNHKKENWKGGSKLQIKTHVYNTGDSYGKEILQLYIQPLQNEGNRALKELKRFKKISLEKGMSKEVIFTLMPQDLAYWDEGKKKWNIESGTYRILIGNSSLDLKSIDLNYFIK